MTSIKSIEHIHVLTNDDMRAAVNYLRYHGPLFVREMPCEILYQIVATVFESLDFAPLIDANILEVEETEMKLAPEYQALYKLKGLKGHGPE